MRYIYVENGEAKGNPQIIPTNWNNISNFNLLDEETIKSYGWLPHRHIKVNAPSGYKYNGVVRTVYENEVVDEDQITEKTSEEIERELRDAWDSVRSKRNYDLIACDWTQLEDAPFTEEKKLEWKTYRQALRDITLQTDPFNIIWPSQPGN
jgi:hypothetical protein